jgi:IS30 family transposase
VPAAGSGSQALRLAEREEISRGLAAGDSCRWIAQRLGRAPSTVSREVARNGGRRRYRAQAADAAADRRARRPKPAKLVLQPRLRAVVEDKLALRWSPQQIAGWSPLAFPEDPVMRVSHETIYLSLFVQSRGALRRELQRCLRTGRAMRYPRGKRLPQGRGQLRDVVLISERPAEAEDRAVPGHWEGDLLLGKRPSAVVTLVERSSRYLTLVALPDGYKAEQVRPALAAAVTRLPEQLRRSLTWDQGKEMAEHHKFTVDTGVAVYFCDPRSPWQRGSNENINGLLRQYLAKNADLRQVTQDRLDASPPSSTAALDKPWASRHHHKSWRRRCPDPLRPPPFLQQPPLPITRDPGGVQNLCPKSTSQNQRWRGFRDPPRRLLMYTGPSSVHRRVKDQLCGRSLPSKASGRLQLLRPYEGTLRSPVPTPVW